MKFNGWQRLWVLFSVVSLVAAIGTTVALLPKRSGVLEKWSYATLEKIRDSKSSLQKYSVSDVQNAYSDMSPEALIQKAQAKYANLDFQGINKRYESDLNQLAAKQGTYIGLGALIWFATVLLVYVFGLSINWVLKGFRQKKAN